MHPQRDCGVRVILGDSYARSEQALKELIDNSWDAEAAGVRVTLRATLSDDPIVVEEDGSGMKSAEVRAAYLNIASPRWTRKGWHPSGMREFRRPAESLAW